MKSIVFGLALLAALPGCCGWCKKKDKCEKPCKKEKMCKTECDSNGKRSKKSSMMDEDKDMNMSNRKKSYKK